MSEEMRRFTRVPFRVEAEVKVGDMSYKTGEILNLSVGGCLLPIAVAEEVGAKCRMKIWLGGCSSEHIVVVEGKIVRVTPQSVAIKFTGVDVDSLHHLQNIVRYNSSDPDAVEREVRDNVGIV